MSKNEPNKSGGRLDHPILRLTSILVATLAILAMLYSLANSLPLIPVFNGRIHPDAVVHTTILGMAVFVFSKQPSSTWGRFILKLVLAIIMASICEDILELLNLIAIIIS